MVEYACLALSRIAEALARSPEHLEMLCNQGLVSNAVQLVTVTANGSMTSQLSSSTYYGLIRLLTSCASGSHAVAESLLQANLSTTMRNLLARYACYPVFPPYCSTCQYKADEGLPTRLYAIWLEKGHLQTPHGGAWPSMTIADHSFHALAPAGRALSTFGGVQLAFAVHLGNIVGLCAVLLGPAARRRDASLGAPASSARAIADCGGEQAHCQQCRYT